jgi:GntR family transcriptional regulator
MDMINNSFDLPDGPKYLRIAKDLRDKIQGGIYSAGEFLPTEEELGGIYKVSRPTIRSAIAKLRETGMLEVIHGIGTRVSKPPIYQHLANQLGFTETIQAQGMKPGTKVLQVQIIKASPEIVGKMGIQAGEDVVEVDCLRTANDQIISYQQSYLRKDFMIEKDRLEEIHSLYQYLEETYGISILFTDDMISAEPAKPSIAKLLGIKTGGTILVLERLTYGTDNQVIELVYSYIRSDHFKYIVRIFKKGKIQ